MKHLDRMKRDDKGLDKIAYIEMDGNSWSEDRKTQGAHEAESESGQGARQWARTEFWRSSWQ